jgi:hypothetical protein
MGEEGLKGRLNCSKRGWMKFRAKKPMSNPSARFHVETLAQFLHVSSVLQEERSYLNIVVPSFIYTITCPKTVALYHINLYKRCHDKYARISPHPMHNERETPHKR